MSSDSLPAKLSEYFNVFRYSNVYSNGQYYSQSRMLYDGGLGLGDWDLMGLVTKAIEVNKNNDYFEGKCTTSIQINCISLQSLYNLRHQKYFQLYKQLNEEED